MKKPEPLKPYAKLKDCVGQKLVGGTLHHKQRALLVFENAWCMVTVRDTEEGPQFSEHQYSLLGGYTYEVDEAVNLGVLSREQVEEYRRRKGEAESIASEERDRREYERLKKKFEGSP